MTSHRDRATLPKIPDGAIVRHADYTGTFEVDTCSSNGEYGITERRIGGLCMWAHPDELTLVCTCPQVGDGNNGWRCKVPHD